MKNHLKFYTSKMI